MRALTLSTDKRSVYLALEANKIVNARLNGTNIVNVTNFRTKTPDVLDLALYSSDRNHSGQSLRHATSSRWRYSSDRSHSCQSLCRATSSTWRYRLRFVNLAATYTVHNYM